MVKVSVIIPIYNVEKYLDQLLDSLVEQSLKDIEIILVDDGSPDNSGAICEKYAKNDQRFHVIHKKNEGVSKARNDGLKTAKGEYVIFCDSDDWLPLNALELLYNEAKRTNADVTIGDVYRYEGGKDVLAQFYKSAFVTDDREFIDKMIQADFYKTYCPMPPSTGPAFGYGGPWNKLVKLSMLQEKGITFDSRVKGIFDDLIYTAHILANATKVAYIPKPVYYYRILPVSITKTYKPNALEINEAIFNSWQEFIDKFDRTDAFKKPYYANIVRRFIEIFPYYFFSSKNQKRLSEVLREMKQTMLSEPYKTAIREVDSKMLTKQAQLWLKLMRQGSPIAIWGMFRMKMLLKTVMGR